MYGKIKDHLQAELEDIKEAGLYKTERIITSPQGAVIKLDDGKEVINFCANNYLGLSSHPEVIQAAKDALDSHGYGMSSVRFICGTQDIHKELEAKIADFYGTEDTILYAAAFDANGGVFEPLLSKEDAIISDSLNHASIIDGVRLCKAARYRYANGEEDASLTDDVEGVHGPLIRTHLGTRPALDQAADHPLGVQRPRRHQAIRLDPRVKRRVGMAVHVLHVSGFAGEIADFRNRRLHAGRQLVAADTGVQQPAGG